jgi:hypothetical protein
LEVRELSPRGDHIRMLVAVAPQQIGEPRLKLANLGGRRDLPFSGW